MKFIERKYFIDKDKEEFYINQKASIGESFYMKGFTHYLFEETKPQLYTYRIKCVKDKSLKSLKASHEDHATKVVGFSYPWLYLRKLSEKGTFNRYDDLDTRITYYMKRLVRLLILTFIYIILISVLSVITNWFYLLLIGLLWPSYRLVILLRKIAFTQKALQIKKGSDD
jgi:hypothetical protein